MEVRGVVREPRGALGILGEPLAQGAVEREVVRLELGPGLGRGGVDGSGGSITRSHTAIEHRTADSWRILPPVPYGAPGHADPTTG